MVVAREMQETVHRHEDNILLLPADVIGTKVDLAQRPRRGVHRFAVTLLDSENVNACGARVPPSPCGVPSYEVARPGERKNVRGLVLAAIAFVQMPHRAVVHEIDLERAADPEGLEADREGAADNPFIRTVLGAPGDDQNGRASRFFL